MSSELSPYAIHRILYLVENDDRRGRKGEKTSVPSAKSHPRNVNDKWRHVDALYFSDVPRIRRSSKPPPSMDYLRSLELALFLRTDLNNDDMRAVFEHGKPLVFDTDLPRLLVPKIIEAFQQLKAEPSFLDVTLGEQPRAVHGPRAPSVNLAELWPQVYVDHLPCGACTQTDEPDKAKKGKQLRKRKNSAKLERFLVEKFHVSSKHFDRQLAVDMHFTLADAQADALRSTTAPALAKGALRKVTVHLASLPCSGSPSGAARNSKTLVLLPEFASEVYGFLNRVHVGASLLANRALKELIVKLKNRLPGPTHVRGVYWLVLRHFVPDLQYSDSRRFKISSSAAPTAYCSLVRHYLSNSHLVDFKTPEADCRFAIKMLAALADCNSSVSALRMGADADGLSDYRSVDTVFNGGMRLDTLKLSLLDHELATLVKTTDFFRMPTIQKLKVLKIELDQPSRKSHAPRQRAVVSSSLWIAGIRLLGKCERFQVKYYSDRRLQTGSLKLVQFCEKYERGEISELVPHFKFVNIRRMVLPFNGDNKIASKVKVGDYEWDVYRFRNAVAGEWLTACVGQEHSAYLQRSVLHIVRGEAYPDASFAAD